MSLDEQQEVLIERHYRVALELAGQRLDKVLAGIFDEFSRSQLKTWMASGHLLVDGVRVKPSLKLAGGESVELKASEMPRVDILPQDIPLDILHSDQDLILVNKPVGLVVHPAPGHPDGTLQNALMFHFPELASLPRSGIVHRLDKDTSGVMVVARNLSAHFSLVKQLQTRKMSREYLALVIGNAAGKGTIDLPIGRHPVDRQRMAVVASGKSAITHYRLLARAAPLSLLQVNLESGRTHQIRVHMCQEKLPLVGDQTYGKRQQNSKLLSTQQSALVSGFRRQALHARRLTLIHPGSGKKASYQAPIAADFLQLLTELGLADGLD